MDEITQEEHIEGADRRAQHWRKLRGEPGVCKEWKARSKVEPAVQPGGLQPGGNSSALQHFSVYWRGLRFRVIT